ncbi:MAG: UvrD-helicase domain-containing protein [Planctomycetota bacterium]
MFPLDWMDARSIAAGREAPDAAALLAGLNDPQRAAVTHGSGPLLILAGAGSGKTRVITRRIAWLVASGEAAPDEILAITFTNKAAREMRERVEAVLPARGLWISTFHAMCARILRRDVEHLGGWTRDFSIYDTADRHQLLKSITKELGYDTQRFRPALLAARLGEWKSRRWESGTGGAEEGGYEDVVFAQVRDRYERAMVENNALDFDDLLVLVLRLFEEHAGVRDSYAHRFRHVLVDEYQDTNRVQYLLTRHLAAGHQNLAVCGDPDQSIYGWRGADIQNILAFEEDFGADSPGGRAVRVVKLEQNYRSTPCILKAAQGVIRHNRSRKEKDLWTEKADVELVHVVECADENDEANAIATRVHDLVARGYRPDQIAVFYRVNWMQRALERGLRLAGVPYQIVGGVEFYARREIRDLVSYLQLLVNPRDDVACARVLNVPARGIGEKSRELLAGWAAERGVPLLAACAAEEARALVRGRARAGIAAVAGLFAAHAALAGGPAATALETLIAALRYVEWLGASADPDAAGRVENVEELLTHAREYDRAYPAGGLRGFLQEVALVSDVDGWDETGPQVTLMTLHSSKGLEFPVVFIAGLEEELLPHALALADARDPAAGEEEERRLMYVGMTRARERLILTHARTRLHYGESSWRLPSRFLAEIPAAFVAGGGEEETGEQDVLGVYETPPRAADLREGDAVEHDHFGYGRVTRLQGAGANARVTVDFLTAGSKVLLVQYAKLRVVRR